MQTASCYHTFEAPQMWSDGINGAPPFLTAMGHYDEAMLQIEGYRKLLFNPDKKLMAHIWDDGRHQFADPAFWSGGNGWTAAGLACVIRSLPADRKNDRNHLVAFAREVIDGCLAHQRPDGLFHNVVDRPDTFVETNLAQMLAFAIYQGITDQWLPASYRPHADRCAQQPASRWTNTASSREPAAPPTSTVPASPLKPSPSPFSWRRLDRRSNRSVG